MVDVPPVSAAVFSAYQTDAVTELEIAPDACVYVFPAVSVTLTGLPGNSLESVNPSVQATSRSPAVVDWAAVTVAA